MHGGKPRRNLDEPSRALTGRGRKRVSPGPEDDLYVPVGIEEYVREGAPPKPVKPKMAPKTSAGATDFEHVKDGARHTLEGLRSFEWAGLFLTVGNYLALPALAVLAVVSSVNLGGARGAVSLVGWLLGAAAGGLFLIGFVFVIMGAWASHIGRLELGILQRREVEKAERYLWRALYTLVPGAAVALVLGFQERTQYRDAVVPYATPIALAVAFVAALLAAWYFALFATQYLRNLTPDSGKKGRRWLRFCAVVAASLPLAVFFAGLPVLLLDYNDHCEYFGACPQEELWTALAPSFGPPAHLSAHLTDYLPVPLAAGSLVVAALLLVSRLFAVLAVSGWRKQVREAEVFVRDKVRLHAPPPMPPG